MKLADLPSIVRALPTIVLMRIDALRWRLQTARFRAVPREPATRKVLFCDLFASPPIAKAQALYGAALRAHGYEPVVLTQERSGGIERLYAATGPARHVFLNDYLTQQDCEEAAGRADALMADAGQLAGLPDLEIDGFRTGRNVLSLVLRRHRAGRFDPADAGQRETARAVLADSLATMQAAKRLVADIGPDTAVFCERGYTPAGEMFDACVLAGVDAIQWVGAPQSDHMLFKRYSLANRDRHPLALSDSTWRALQDVAAGDAWETETMERLESHYRSGAWYNRQQLQTGKAVKSRAEVVRQLGLDPKKKTAVIFSHILYDATFFFGDSLFPDYETWLVECVRAAIANPALNWVVKVHPVNVWKSAQDGVAMEQLEQRVLAREFGELPAHVRIMPADTDINTFSLFHAIDYGLTVRGTIGMELPCYGIPTVTAGTGRYDGRGFTIDPRTAEELRAVLLRLHQVPALDGKTINLARRYAYGTFFLRPVPISSFLFDFHANTFGLAALRSNVTLNAAAPADLSTAADLGRVARWIASGTGTDLLAEDLLQREFPRVVNG